MIEKSDTRFYDQGIRVLKYAVPFTILLTLGSCTYFSCAKPNIEAEKKIVAQRESIVNAQNKLFTTRNNLEYVLDIRKDEERYVQKPAQGTGSAQPEVEYFLSRAHGVAERKEAVKNSQAWYDSAIAVLKKTDSIFVNSPTYAAAKQKVKEAKNWDDADPSFYGFPLILCEIAFWYRFQERRKIKIERLSKH